MKMIQIRALAGVYVNGQALAPGQVLAVDPLVAAHCCATHRAELVHDADEVHLRDAVTADNARALKLDGRPWVRPQPPEPWERRG